MPTKLCVPAKTAKIRTASTLVHSKVENVPLDDSTDSGGCDQHVLYIERVGVWDVAILQLLHPTPLYEGPEILIEWTLVGKEASAEDDISNKPATHQMMTAVNQRNRRQTTVSEQQIINTTVILSVQ